MQAIALCIKGYCTPSLKLTYFVCFLKIINTCLKNDIYFESKLFKKVEKGIEILVGQMVYKLLIKTVKILF